MGIDEKEGLSGPFYPVPAYYFSDGHLLIYVDGEIVARIPERFYADLGASLTHQLGKIRDDQRNL